MKPRIEARPEDDLALQANSEFFQEDDGEFGEESPDEWCQDVFVSNRR